MRKGWKKVQSAKPSRWQNYVDEEGKRRRRRISDAEPEIWSRQFSNGTATIEQDGYSGWWASHFDHARGRSTAYGFAENRDAAMIRAERMQAGEDPFDI